MRRRVITFGVLVISVILVGVGISELFRSKNIGPEEAVLGIDNVSYKSVPYIVSIPDNFVSAGGFYRYTVEVSDLDSDIEEISVYLTERPIWMYIEGFEVRGTPTESGTYKFVVTVSDGVNSSSQVNYVLVVENE